MRNFNIFSRVNPDSHPTVNRRSRLMSVQGTCSFCLTKFLTTLLLLTLAVGQIDAQKNENTIQNIAKQDTAFIITPNISTHDTLYLKHEDAKAIEQTWWDLHSNEIVQLIIALLLGGGVALLTTRLNNQQELKREEQRISKELKLQQQLFVMTEGVKREHQLYEALLDIQNAKTLAEMSQLTDAFAIQLDKAQLDIRDTLYRTANNMHAYYSRLAAGTIEKDPEREKRYFDQYREIFNNA